MSEQERWGIVGGGILGMALAHNLAKQGKQVTLFEADYQLGGLASVWQLGDVIWDKHYHVTLLSDTELRSLLAELGLEQEMMWVETRTGLYTNGKLYSISNALEFLRYFPLNLIGKIRFALTIIYGSKIRSPRKLEQISVVDWLTKWSGKYAVKKIWLPLLRSKLGENYRKASAAFIWAIIARLYAARRTGLKKEMFGYLPGGYARILARFAQVLEEEKVEIKVGHRATLVEQTGQGIRVNFANGQQEVFDQLVLTTPAAIASRICPELTSTEKMQLNDIQYQGIICASLLLRQPLANFYVTNITDSWVPFTGVIEMSTLVDPVQFSGHNLVYLPKYVAPEDPAFELSDEELQSQFWDALKQMYPHLQDDDLLSFRVSRVRRVLAISTLNYSQKLPSMSTSIAGLHIINSAHICNGTLNVNETIQLANQGVEHLLSSPSGKANSDYSSPLELVSHD